MDVTKFMLAAIALGLWANAALTLVRPAEAQSDASVGDNCGRHPLVSGVRLAAEIRKFAIKRSQGWANDQPNSRGGVAACTFDSNCHPTPIGMLRHVDDYERSTDLFRRAGDLVDKILRGSKPSNIPVEQPIAFELVINLTKRRLSGFFVRADEMIE